uniref:AlNc14C22G2245 protein n=1 Tax=Albugo laibachii Nc14 TaxID=890382 RepID=F0W5T0_9STRA|nr:AlNc14C22G2245 [Albugo laibachii Nc14]|eukprot:CCA16471.1 AlNc14C22G2245 [Albugo laibachii Nc14]
MTSVAPEMSLFRSYESQWKHLELRKDRMRNQISQLELTLEDQITENTYRDSIQRSLLSVMAQKCRTLALSNAAPEPIKQSKSSSKTESISYLVLKSSEKHKFPKKAKTLDHAPTSSSEEDKEETPAANEIPFHSSTTEELLQILSKESSESEYETSYPSLILSPPEPKSSPLPSIKTPDTVPHRSYNSDEDERKVEKTQSKRSKPTEPRALPKKRKISQQFDKKKSKHLREEKSQNMYQTPIQKKRNSGKVVSSAAKRREFHALFREMVGDRPVCEPENQSERRRVHADDRMDEVESNEASIQSASEDFEDHKRPKLIENQPKKVSKLKSHARMSTYEPSEETKSSDHSFQVQKAKKKRNVTKVAQKREKSSTTKTRKKAVSARKEIDQIRTPIFKPQREIVERIDEVERSALSRFNSGLLGRTRKQAVPLSRPPKVAITPGRSSISSVMAQRITFRSSDTNASAPKFSFFDAFMNTSKPVIPRLKTTSLSK